MAGGLAPAQHHLAVLDLIAPQRIRQKTNYPHGLCPSLRPPVQIFLDSVMRLLYTLAVE